MNASMKNEGRLPIDLDGALDIVEIGQDGLASAYDGDLWLTSHFQPIISLSHQRVIGYEGLLRARNDGGHPVPPTAVLEAAMRRGELVALDRLARVLHVLNRPPGNSQWLFLNVHPEVFVDGVAKSNFMIDLLMQQEMATSEVVIEVLEDAIHDGGRFRDTVEQLRGSGFLIALDDFGAGSSNFDRVWTVRPDIVKLDRSFATRMENCSDARRLMPRIVSLLHEAGSLVLLEGIETETQAHIALDADIDFVQGYYFSRPAARPNPNADSTDSVQALWQNFRTRETATVVAQHERIAPYKNALGFASVLLSVGEDPAKACAGFLALPQANFCYLLDGEGLQSGENLWADTHTPRPHSRFRPLADARDARWSHRPYFRRAIRQLDRIHVTRPYLSATTASLCVTLAVGFLKNGELHVLCGDIAWNDGEAGRAF